MQYGNIFFFRIYIGRFQFLTIFCEFWTFFKKSVFHGTLKICPKWHILQVHCVKVIWAKDGGSGTPQYFFRKQIHQSKFNKVYSWMRLFVQFILQVKLLYSYKLPLLTRTKLLATMFWDIKCKYFSARVFLSQDGYRWISSCGPSRVGQSSCHGNSFTKIPSEMEVALLHKEHLGTSGNI